MLPDSQKTYDHIGERRHETINNRWTCKIKFYAMPSAQSRGSRALTACETPHSRVPGGWPWRWGEDWGRHARKATTCQRNSISKAQVLSQQEKLPNSCQGQAPRYLQAGGRGSWKPRAQSQWPGARRREMFGRAEPFPGAHSQHPPTPGPKRASVTQLEKNHCHWGDWVLQMSQFSQRSPNIKIFLM